MWYTSIIGMFHWMLEKGNTICNTKRLQFANYIQRVATQIKSSNNFRPDTTNANKPSISKVNMLFHQICIKLNLPVLIHDTNLFLQFLHPPFDKA